EGFRGRDAAAGGVPEPALAAGPHRRGRRRPGRDLLRRPGGRGLRPRDDRALPPWPGPAAGRPPRPRPLRLRRLPLQWRRDARQLGARHRPLGSLGQGDRAARLPAPGRQEPGPDQDLQHLRRLPLRPLPAPAGGRQLGPAGGDDRGGGGAVRGPRRLPPPGGRPRPEPPLRRHHRDEDLAVRPLRRGLQRPGHLVDRPRPGAGAVPPDPGRGRQRDGDHGRVPLAVELADGPPDCPRPGAVRALLVRGPAEGGQPRRPGGVRRRHRDPDDDQRDALDPVVVPGGVRAGGGRGGDARPLVVRRHRGGQEDRDDGRGLPAAGGAPRLHRAGGPDRQHPPLDQSAERAGPGDRPGLLRRLVPGAADGAAGRLGRHRGAAPRPRLGDRAEAGAVDAAGRDGADEPGGV
ncbi:MAG: Gluconate dehydratase, partial [uncultured Thermomicrobiales bacterium]